MKVRAVEFPPGMDQMFQKILAALSSDYGPVLERFGQEVLVMTQQVGVEKSEDISGAPFKPLKPATIKRKRKRGSPWPDKPLLDTSAMYQSIVYRVNLPDSVRSGPTARTKDGKPYPLFVNMGTVRGIPPRTFIGLRKEHHKDVLVELGKWINMKLERVARTL